MLRPKRHQPGSDPESRRHDPGEPGLRRGMMKATFTEEQQQLAELAERMAERMAADAREGGDPDAGWPLLVETGLVGLRLPARAGGGATSAVEVAVVAEALGRHAAPVPFVGPVLAGDLLTSAGAPTDLLEEVVTGQRRLTVALDRTLSRPGRLDGDPDGDVIGWDSFGAESLVGLVEEPDGTVRVALSPGPARRWRRAISPASW